MTMERRFAWVDAFAARAFEGNPCAVVFDADGLDLETRLAFTRETRLSECAFLQTPAPRDGAPPADFAARYYTASGEILLAGHPTIATVTTLLDAGLVTPGARFTLEIGAGVIDIEIDETGEVTMVQPAPRFGRRWRAEEIAPLVGLAAEDIAHAPRTVSTGTAFCVTVLRDQDALRRAVLDVDALHAFTAQEGCDFREPFLTTLGGATPAGDTFSRLLLPPPEPLEDPFTGSASGCMAAYLWSEGLSTASNFVVEQGHWMGRPSSGRVTRVGPAAAPEAVRLSGRGVVVLRGALAV